VSATTLSVSAEPDLVSVQVRNLIAVTSRIDDVLDVSPLRFSLSVPIRTTTEARIGADKLLPALQRRIESDVTAVVEGARKSIEKDVLALAVAMRKLLEHDGGASADAHVQATKLTKPASAQFEHAVDALAPGVREAVERIVRANEFKACFAKQRLTSLGSWGFARSEGIRVRPGLIKYAPVTDDGGDRLWRDLTSARSHARQFVLIASDAPGLAIGNSIGGGDLARARQMGGSGAPLYGEVSVSGGVYHFQLDKASSQGKRDKLAKRLRDRIKTLCRKSIAVRFDDNDSDIDGERD
jgi:hypothetical protein